MAQKIFMEKGRPVRLSEAIDYASGAIVSKTLIETKAGTLTLFAFDEGQALSEHTAPFDAVVQVLDGEATLTIGGETITAPCGSLVIMPAHVPHAVKASQRCKMLLTMIRA